MSKFRVFILASLTLILVACGGSEEAAPTANSASVTPASSSSAESEFGRIDQERLNNASNEPEQWLTYGGTYNEQRYSGLDQINTENIGELGLSWYQDIRANQGQQSTLCRRRSLSH